MFGSRSRYLSKVGCLGSAFSYPLIGHSLSLAYGHMSRSICGSVHGALAHKHHGEHLCYFCAKALAEDQGISLPEPTKEVRDLPGVPAATVCINDQPEPQPWRYFIIIADGAILGADVISPALQRLIDTGAARELTQLEVTAVNLANWRRR